MRPLLRAIDAISAAAAVLAAACLALLSVTILAEVASIALLRRSLDFSWEYGGFLMAGAFFLGLPWTLNSGGHVRVLILQEHLPRSLHRLFDLLATLAGLAIAAYLAWALGQLAWSSFLDGSRTFTTTATPLFLPQGVVALGAALLGLQLLARAIRIVLGQSPDTGRPPGLDDLG